MTQEILTVANLIDAFGGPAEFGRAIGVSTIHASVIKQRKSIPTSRWPSLLDSDVGKKIGLTADDLLRIHTDHSEVTRHG